MHEDYRRDHTPAPSTDRVFGIVFAAFFCIVSLWPVWRGGTPRIWALGVAGAFCLLVIVAPAALHPLNVVWAIFGRLLHRLTNPLITGILFYGIFTPVAASLTALKRKPLPVRFDPNAESYWIQRESSEPRPESMRRQF